MGLSHRPPASRPALLCGVAVLSLFLGLAPGCGQELYTWDAGPGPEEDGGSDGGDGGGLDAGSDAGTDAGSDAGIDAGPRLVISELAGEGESEPNDEFVELYNPEESAVSLAGYSLEYRSSGGNQGVYHEFSGTASVPAHGFFLVGHTAFVGTADEHLTRNPDTGLTMSAANGAVFLMNAAGIPLDQVGWGSGAAEGAATVGINGGQSVERKANASSTAASMSTGADVTAGNGYDSNNNQQDFVLRSVRDPQNTASPVEP